MQSDAARAVAVRRCEVNIASSPKKEPCAAQAGAPQRAARGLRAERSATRAVRRGFGAALLTASSVQKTRSPWPALASPVIWMKPCRARGGVSREA